MNIIAVEKNGLMAEFYIWGVSSEYADFFISKCSDQGEMVSLKSFVFNDTVHLDDKCQWLLASAAFWCRAYREAEDDNQQTEALSAMRTLYFAAGLLGVSPVVTLINAWWGATYELHMLASPSQSESQHKAFKSWFLNTSLFKH